MKESNKPVQTKVKKRSKLYEWLVVGWSSNRMALAETFVVSVLSIMSWLFIDREGLTNGKEYFFWPMLGPIVISLRYGFAKGIQCFVFVALTMKLLEATFGYEINFGLSTLVGTGLITMITGEFTDHWRRSIRSNELNYKYMDQKLQNFTQSYYLLKISHDQLEQRAAGKLMSLRNSIQMLQQTALSKVDNRLESLGDECLHILSDVVGMYEAGIYIVKNNTIQPECISFVGKEHSLVIDDPMVLEMLDKNKIYTPANLHDFEDDELHYQLVVPLVDSSGKMQGVVLAEKVKFVALTNENLALISLVASYMANFMCENLYTPVLKAEQFSIFSNYMEQLRWNNEHYGADSALVLFVDNSHSKSLPIKKFIDYRRGADIYWSCYTADGQPALVALLPMTTVFEAKQFIDRLLSVLRDKYDADVRDLETFGPYVVFEQLGEVNKLLAGLGSKKSTGSPFSSHSKET
jgi:hypothetical protein